MIINYNCKTKAPLDLANGFPHVEAGWQGAILRIGVAEDLGYTAFLDPTYFTPIPLYGWPSNLRRLCIKKVSNDPNIQS